MKFAKSHEWVKVEGDIGTVGISDHAQNELTEIVFVELPQVGKVLQAGEPSCVVESVKSASDAFTPVGGEVIEINEAVMDDPAMINNDAEGEGWFFKIKLTDLSELDNLMTKEEYQSNL